MKKLVLIACCLVICLMATNAMAANIVTVQSRTFTSGQQACTVGVFIENDIPLNGIVLPFEIRTQSGGAFYNGGLLAATWNFMPTGRLKNSPLSDVGADGGEYPAGNVTRRQYADVAPDSLDCSGPISQHYSVQATRGDTISPDAFFLASVSTGDPNIGEEISLQPGTDGATPSMRLVLNLIAGQNGCIVIDTACITPANHILYVDDQSQPVRPDFVPGLLTVGSGSCAVVVNQPPTAVCQNIQVAANGSCQGTATAAQVNNGSSDPEDGANVTLALVPAGPYALGANPVSLIVTDQGGLADTCAATITVVDQTAPVLNCPSNIAVQCGGNVPAAYANAAALISAGGTVTDNCPNPTVALLDQVSDGNTCPNVITRRYVATDGAGNKDTCTQTITVDDTQNPVIVNCPNDTVINLPNGQTSTTVLYSDANISDNCNNVNIIHSPLSNSTFNLGTTQVRLIATDLCGNADTCFFNVTVNEEPAGNTPPNALCQDLDVDATGTCDASVSAAQVNNGSNDAETEAGNLVMSLVPPGPYPLGLTVVYLVVVDEGGLRDSCSATIDVIDVTDPTITCPPDILVECDYEIPLEYDSVGFLSAGGSFSDDCGPVTFSLSGSTDQGSCPRIIERTYVVEDGAGNIETCIHTITVNDTTKPTFECPEDIQVIVSAGSTDTVVTYAAGASDDNCGSVSFEYLPPSGSSFPVGATVVTILSSDLCGNTDTCEFTITVTEAEEDAPPVAICTDVKVSADANCEADADINNGSFDPDGGSVSTSQNPAGPYPEGATLVLLTVTDDEGDTDTCSAWVTVNDVTPPVVTCPGDISVPNDLGQCGAIVDFSATATDNCDPSFAIAITYNPPPGPGYTFAVGTTQVEVIAADLNGNADTCYFDVTVNDTEAPTAFCPEDWIASNDLGECGAIVDWGVNGVGSSDNCEVESSVYTPPAGSFFPVGTTPVEHVVTDAAGNADTCSFTVTVNDTEAPGIVCPTDIKVFAPFGQDEAIVNFAAPGVTENCPGSSLVCHPASGSIFPVGQTVVACTTTDAAGNWAACEFTVTVNPGSLEAPGPHTETDTLLFKVTCACDTQSIDVYCVEEFGKGGDTSSGCLVYVQTQVPGISASPVPAQAPGSVDIIGCGIGLDAGSYSGWVFLHAATGAKTDSFWVVLEVNEDEPGLDIVPDTLKFTYTGDIFNDKLCLLADIYSTGCDEQCWQFIGPSGDWVWVEPTSGTTPDEIEICVFPCTLGVGVYYQTLTFCACPKGDDGPNPVGNCAQLVVQLTVVNPSPVLVVDPLEIHFEIDCEKKALPVPVEVSNGGGGVLDWTAWTLANWFTVEPGSGTALDTFYVSIIPDSIDCPNVCDTLIDSICVTGNKGCAINSPQYVLVELIICPDDTVICDSICGTVYDCSCLSPNGCSLAGVMVELWSSYPDGVILDTVTAELGDFCFDVEPGVEYDLRFWKEGYCTDTIDGWSCEDGGLVICLQPLGFVLPESPMFHDYYSTNATFEGFPILPGDVIHATDSNGQVVGLAYVTVAGEYLIHVLANVPKGDPDPIDEGAEFGELVQLWLNCECPVTVNEPLANFGNTQFDAAWDCRPTGICCELCEGWSMFSYGIQLPDYSREIVLATVDLNYDAVRSGRCDNGPNPVISWFDNRPVNDLTTVEPWYGHDIHMLQDDTLCLEGYFIPVDTEIPLCLGWNYIPYWPMESDSREHALASIDGNYDYLYNIWACGDDPSDSWVGSRPVNDLFCLEPCKGYWIRMTTEDTLVYPTSGYDCTEPLPKVSPSSASGQLKPSPIMADFWSNTDASTSGLRDGDIISVRSNSGQLIGETVVGENGTFLLHVFGDVPNTPAVEGAQPGEDLRFEVNGMAASVEGNTSFGDRENSQITVRSSGSNPIPNEYSLLQNYPNPFNAGTVIPFTMKDASEWSLTVYNIMGQTVQTFEGFDAPGTVRVNWNGLDRNGSNVPSGVYFYRVTTDTWTATKKMTLLK